MRFRYFILVETSYGKSSEIIQCNTKDAAADELAKRIGGQSSSAFADDLIQREFDVISDQYIAQAKPPLKCVNKTVRSPMMKQLAELRDKYDLHMTVERFVSEEYESDKKYLRK